jgi:molecular chaperone DnaJ
VKIPAGVGNGAKIRLKGEGEQGPPGSPAGDLILTVRVAGHASFVRKGLDVESVVEIGIADAALGTEREVETLKGAVKLKIPAGVQPGSRLRLKGRGVRDRKGRTGDHYAVIRVKVPKKLTERQRKLLEEYGKAE